MQQNWWKFVGVALLFYTIIMGLLGPVPELHILDQTIRNLYFHVPMWFTMTFLLFLSFVFSIIYLATKNEKHDVWASQLVATGMFFAAMGLLTGMTWAKFTWGAWWINDPKLNGVAIGMLTYLAYGILRDAISDVEKKARISAVYNIFAFLIFMELIFILPRQSDSLHPGNGGNPGFNRYDLDNEMRKVFYPAVIGFIILGMWITSLRVRIRKIEIQVNEQL